jgi:hypothetical protein
MEWFSQKTSIAGYQIPQLGASSWRHHRTLYHLQIQYLTLGERRMDPVFQPSLAERAN